MEFINPEDIIGQTILAKEEPEYIPPVEDPLIVSGDSEKVEEVEELDVEEQIFSPEEMADGFLDLGEVISDFLFPAAYKMIAFTKEDKSLLKTVSQKVRRYKVEQNNNKDVEPITLSNLELEVLEKYEEHSEYEKEIVPLSDSERTKIRKPLLRLVQAYTIKINPKSALIFAIVIVCLTRLAPLAAARRSRNKSL